jgi:hypothetical protein
MAQVQARRISVKVAGQDFLLDVDEVEHELRKILPEPLTDHFVVIGGRRYPPKQILALVTGLDRADFTTHQARRIFRRLGFTVGRRSDPPPSVTKTSFAGPHDGEEADLLRPFIGQWVAQSGLEVLVAADRPQDVLAWLERHDKQADAMFRVPERSSEATGVAPL